MINLVSIRTSTRGKNPRILTYEGIGKVTPFDKDAEGKDIPADKQESKSDAVDVKGVVTSFKDAVELVKTTVQNSGDGLQFALDFFADGFNLYQRSVLLESDEFDGLLDGIDWAAVAKRAGVEDEVVEKKGKNEAGEEVVLSTRNVNAIETVKGQFKRTARGFAALNQMELAEVVPMLSTKMPKVATA